MKRMRKLFNQTDGAKYLGISRQTFNKWARRGSIKAYDEGYKLYSAEELDRFKVVVREETGFRRLEESKK